MRTIDMHTSELVEIVEIPLKFGCDPQGQFWGEGARLWNALGSTIDLHIRAHTYESAKALLIAKFPDVIIYSGE
jgi:hypothetical protein